MRKNTAGEDWLKHKEAKNHIRKLLRHPDWVPTEKDKAQAKAKKPKRKRSRRGSVRS